MHIILLNNFPMSYICSITHVKRPQLEISMRCDKKHISHQPRPTAFKRPPEKWQGLIDISKQPTVSAPNNLALFLPVDGHEAELRIRVVRSIDVSQRQCRDRSMWIADTLE